MTANSWLNLPLEFNRRLEDRSLVLWRTEPRLTLWISKFNIPSGADPAKQFSICRERISETSFHIVETIDRFNYRLQEDGEIPAFYGFVFGPKDFLQAGMYMDDENNLALLTQIFNSIELKLSLIHI